MSSDSEIIGRRTHSPRTFKIPRHQYPEGYWYTLESQETLGTGDYQRSVQQGTTNLWITDNKGIKERHCDLGEIEAMIIASRGWNGYHGTNGRHEDLPKSPRPRAHPKTVEDIEKWLKIRPSPSPTMDHSKQEIETVDKYLNTDFLEKDDLSIDEKLTLPYDAPYDQFQELNSEKYLEVCGKDGFILPEFQLDNLDPLALSNNDMMVAGEILPSTSTHSLEYPQNLSKTSKNPPSIDFSFSTPQKSIFPEKITLKPSKTDPLSEKIINNHLEINQEEINEENCEKNEDICEEKKKIVKKKRKSMKIEENNLENGDVHVQSDSKEGIMAVVAISTDKISNMTQIVINTGKEEQIYQGKTSELMEATGYFPKMSGWVKEGERKEGGSSHEVIISSALEELGFGEEALISMTLTATEHGKTWVCPREDCRREFNRLYALKGHLLAHYGVRPFKCDSPGCTWAFHSDFKLKRHKETHLKRKDYVCQMADCNRRFTTIYNLWTHEKLHSRPSKITCKVPNCNDRFQTKRALEIHMKTHPQEHAPYICPIESCGKRYYSSNALTSHQRCHSYKEIDIKCSWTGCGKIFDKPCRLKAHVRSHTGSKPYSCTYPSCEWAFSSSSKLKRHEKKHTNERKFTCDYPNCCKAFMRSEHLKEHRLTHSEDRLFQCYICETRFSAKSSLYVHIKKHQNRENNGNFENFKLKNFGVIEKSERIKHIFHGLRGNNDDDDGNDGHGTCGNGDFNEKKNYSVNNKILDKKVIDKIKLKFICNFEGCKKILCSRASLKSHTARVHGCNEVVKVFESEKREEMMNFRFFEGQMENCGGVGVSKGGILRGRKGQGAARTWLTCDDVMRMKRRNFGGVGASDVVLGGGEVGEGLLLNEELPSMFYQDELGSECQILMLETGNQEEFQ